MALIEEIAFKAIKMTQPIGDFYVGVMDAKDLVSVSVADVRRLHENEFDEYIGIQRRLSPSRTKELKKYVCTEDATFPTAVILAVDSENAVYDEENGVLKLVPSEKKQIFEVASILDGQHRVDGLTALPGRGFEVSVSVFVGADVATQANIFATVNLAQTKVNRSLVYDLLDYEKKRSPQKTAHHVVVALDQIANSPFRKRIKRLGSATEGRSNETITQAALVEPLMTFITSDAMSDRDTFLKRLVPERPSHQDLQRHPFRELFLSERDTDIARILLNFFLAVQAKWPSSWDDLERRGNVLPKTNGVKALMRFLRPVYNEICERRGSNSIVPEIEEFAEFVNAVELEDEQFNTQTFPPGTSGESGLYKILLASMASEQDDAPLLDRIQHD